MEVPLECNCLRKLNYVFFSDERGAWRLVIADMGFTVCYILSVLLCLSELDWELVDWFLGFYLLLVKIYLTAIFLTTTCHFMYIPTFSGTYQVNKPPTVCKLNVFSKISQGHEVAFLLHHQIEFNWMQSEFKLFFSLLSFQWKCDICPSIHPSIHSDDDSHPVNWSGFQIWLLFLESKMWI